MEDDDNIRVITCGAADVVGGYEGRGGVSGDQMGELMVREEHLRGQVLKRDPSKNSDGLQHQRGAVLRAD